MVCELLVNILIIGDSCKDVFIYGNCKRMAPAAPVPVFVPELTKQNKGMAGNVYENFRSLGVDCHLLTNGNEITKTRYVDKYTNHMIVRVDSGEEQITRIGNLDNVDFSSYDAVVISDYNKGFLLEEDIEKISRRHDFVFMDTKKLLGDWAKSIKFIKINEEEYKTTKHLLEDRKWYKDKLIITLGSEGCAYEGVKYPVAKVEIKDLTGAGDTFLTGFVYHYLNTRSVVESLVFANQCATKVVQKKGVNTINDI